MTNLNRRTVLKQSAALALTTAIPTSEASAQSIVTRRDVSLLAANDPILVAYRKAIAAMKALPATDPRNWTSQAQIHNNKCPHRNWFFLPWHRAYLVAFERICRQLSGMPTFALPYWNWTTHPQLPAAFASPTFMGNPNPLFDANRSSQTVTIPNSVAGPSVMSAILTETTFEIFASRRPAGQNNTSASWQRVGSVEGPLESNPHDQVHVRISGDMATFMSPLDPIFWLHHCNIDRIWDQWNRSGRSNTSDPLWRNFPFNGNFVTPSGTGTTPFNVAISGLQNITSFGYRYVAPLIAVANLAFIPKPIDLSKPLHSTRIEMPPAAVFNKTNEFRIKLDPAPTLSLERIRLPSRARTDAAVRPANAPGRVIAIIHDVEPPTTGNAEVRVFVNDPQATPETSTQDRHYAGSFTFFSAGHDDHSAKHSYLIDLTETVARLRHAEMEIKDEIVVQLVPVPIPGVAQATDFKIGSIEIAIF
jgi:tyrosinase